jgi:hypothetical protein
MGHENNCAHGSSSSRRNSPELCTLSRSLENRGRREGRVAYPVVQRAFSDVMQLVKPFELLDSPDIQSRIKACAETATVPG